MMMILLNLGGYFPYYDLGIYEDLSTYSFFITLIYTLLIIWDYLPSPDPEESPIICQDLEKLPFPNLHQAPQLDRPIFLPKKNYASSRRGFRILTWVLLIVLLLSLFLSSFSADHYFIRDNYFNPFF